MPRNFIRTLSITLVEVKIVKKPDLFVKRDMYSSRNVAIDVVKVGGVRFSCVAIR